MQKAASMVASQFQPTSNSSLSPPPPQSRSRDAETGTQRADHVANIHGFVEERKDHIKRPPQQYEIAPKKSMKPAF